MIVLYSTGCPNCKVLERLLKRQNVDFVISDDIEELIKKGFQTAPVLSVDGELKQFKEAIDWVKKQGE